MQRRADLNGLNMLIVRESKLIRLAQHDTGQVDLVKFSSIQIFSNSKNHYRGSNVKVRSQLSYSDSGLFLLLANARRVLPFWGCFGNRLGYGILSFVPPHPNFCYKVITN